MFYTLACTSHCITEPPQRENPHRVPAPWQAGGYHGHDPNGPERPGQGGNLLRPRAGSICGAWIPMMTQASSREKHRARNEPELQLKPQARNLVVLSSSCVRGES